jgi:hypothetical protein
MDSPISVATLERQISREGKRWGVVPEYDPDDGRVRVVELVHRAEAHHGLGEVERGPYRRICTVDDENPFSAALANRVQNGETDLAQRFKRLRAQEEAEQRAKEEEQRAETLSLWRARRRIIALPTGIVPAGLAVRRMRGR